MNIVTELVFPELCWLNVQHPYHQSSNSKLLVGLSSSKNLRKILPPTQIFVFGSKRQRNETTSVRKPYLHFCQQLAERLRVQPEVKDGSAMVDLRRFCGGQNKGFGRLERIGKKAQKGDCWFVVSIAMLENFESYGKLTKCWNQLEVGKSMNFLRDTNLNVIFHVCVGNPE